MKSHQIKKFQPIQTVQTRGSSSALTSQVSNESSTMSKRDEVPPISTTSSDSGQPGCSHWAEPTRGNPEKTSTSSENDGKTAMPAYSQVLWLLHIEAYHH